VFSFSGGAATGTARALNSEISCEETECGG
jgi:hypothetical protein